MSATCEHLKTERRFGGEVICTNCRLVVGYWGDSQPKISVKGPSA